MHYFLQLLVIILWTFNWIVFYVLMRAWLNEIKDQIGYSSLLNRSRIVTKLAKEQTGRELTLADIVRMRNAVTRDLTEIVNIEDDL